MDTFSLFNLQNTMVINLSFATVKKCIRCGTRVSTQKKLIGDRSDLKIQSNSLIIKKIAPHIWIYFLDRIRGPFSLWEIKLLATKYRDFFIYLGNQQWVAYGNWDGRVVNEDRPSCIPKLPQKHSIKAKRFIKRRILRDCH